MAKWKVAKAYKVKPCKCGCDAVDLWTDTGTSWFFLECANSACELDGPMVDLDDGTRRSLFDVFADWNAGHYGDESDD